jgi:phosphatidylinositol alpha-mannosyltransferase
VKVGIVVPYSWSYWGGVVEHAEEQVRALEQLGIDSRLIVGYDPPGPLSRLVHPRAGRLDQPPGHVIEVGRSVITPANDSLANIVLSPAAVHRVKRILREERFDLLHVHEPLTPVISVAALAHAEVPVVATFHAGGSSRWRALAIAAWGFLLDRIDVRIAVSEAARTATQAYAPGDYRLIPNGVRIPDQGNLGGRDNSVVFIGRHEPRKGLPTLLGVWPRIHAATGARLRVIGADPLAVRLLTTRRRLDDTGIDSLGILPTAQLDHELARTKLLVAPSLKGESFGMVLTRAFASGTPAIASDIDGYRQVVEPACGRLVPPGNAEALTAAILELLADEPARCALGAGARTLAEHKYAWPQIATQLADIYGQLLAKNAVPVERVAESTRYVAATGEGN